MCILSRVWCGVSSHLWRLEMPVMAGWLAGVVHKTVTAIYFCFLKALRESPMCVRRQLYISKLKLRLILYVSWPPMSSFFLQHLIIHAFGTFQPFDAKPCLTFCNKYRFQIFICFLGLFTYSILHVTLIIKQRDMYCTCWCSLLTCLSFWVQAWRALLFVGATAVSLFFFW